MNREDLTELHYITPLNNVASIISHGILSYRHAKKVPHSSIAMEEIQDRRAKKIVPGGLPVHKYVNLYICARNKMLYKVKDKHAELCILRVNTAVLDLPGVVVVDRNASSDYARFAPAPEGLQNVDRDLVFAKYWTHPDPIETWRHGTIICAEVLVPDRVDPRFILGAYVSCPDAKIAFEAKGVNIPVAINSYLFFR